jgi:hypothetical protein
MVDRVARGSVVADLIVADLIVPDLILSGVVVAWVAEAESAGRGSVVAGVVIDVGATVGAVATPAEFPPASSSLPGFLAGRPLALLNNP